MWKRWEPLPQQGYGFYLQEEYEEALRNPGNHINLGKQVLADEEE